MSLDELKSLILNADWFSRLGGAYLGPEHARLRSLRALAGYAEEDAEQAKIVAEMELLPSARDEQDPIHGNDLENRAISLGKKEEFSKCVRDVYRQALESLNRFAGHPALKVGPHDFSEAAKGAALFAVRRATYEVLLGSPGFWCELMRIYNKGHWPCGRLPDQRVVVL